MTPHQVILYNHQPERIHGTMFAISILFAIAPRAVADCRCGYTVNSTSSGDYALFTNRLSTDFTQTLDGWIPQAYNVTPSAARGPCGKVTEVGNVIQNSDTGLELWVRSTPLTIDGGRDVPIAEIVSSREDILDRSFRVGMQTTKVNGTCGAFFWHHQ